MTTPDSVSAEEKLRDVAIDAMFEWARAYDYGIDAQIAKAWTEACDLLTAYRDHVYAAGVAEGKVR